MRFPSFPGFILLGCSSAFSFLVPAGENEATVAGDRKVMKSLCLPSVTLAILLMSIPPASHSQAVQRNGPGKDDSLHVDRIEEVMKKWIEEAIK
jgi:hypothetical protein